MSDTFDVGDRCQWVDRDDGTATGGTVETIIPPKRMKTNNYWSLPQSEQDEMITYATVKWDDGTTDTVDIDDLDNEDSEYEREFRQVSQKASNKIAKKLAQAEAALEEAVALSEKYGVPFYTSISFISQSYMPASMSEKFPEVDRDFMEGLTDSSGEYDGWQHSAVCW